MDPLFAAGMLAAAYDLGLSHRGHGGAPGPRGSLMRDPSVLAGLLGFAAGHHGSDDVMAQNRALQAALQRMAQIRSQERAEAMLHEQQMREALTGTEHRRQMLELARWAQLASMRGSPQSYNK
jgi:hypothetical protein